MSRPRKINQSVNVHLMLPEDLVAAVSLALYSPLQERIPLGAMSAFYERAARDALARVNLEKANEQAADG
jgi:hypothetical protein